MALSKWRRSRAVVMGAVGAGAIAFGLLAPTAGAAPSSSLVVTPSSMVIDLQNTLANPSSQSLTVGLDSNCINPLSGGVTYGVLAGSFTAGVAAIQQNSGASGLQCGQSASFTVTGQACGQVTIPFDPIVGNKGGQNPGGLQKQLGGGSLTVTVEDSLSLDPNCGGTVTSLPGSGGRPAAPAVANYYLNNSDSTYLKNCQNFLKVGNKWRGVVISDIAGWMPLPESQKDDTTKWLTDDDWMNFVSAQVDYFCGVAGTVNQPTSRVNA